MSDKRIPRPRNAFILFRQHHHRLLIEEWTAQGVDIPHNSKISKILGTRWKALDEHERAHWEQLARQEKSEHEKRYPDYRYKPVRRHKRRGSRTEPPSVDGHHAEKRRLIHHAVPPPLAPPLAPVPRGPPATCGPALTSSAPTFAGPPGPSGSPLYQPPCYVPMQSYLPRFSRLAPQLPPQPPLRPPSLPPPGMLHSMYPPVPSAPVPSAPIASSPMPGASIPGTSSVPGTGWQWQRTSYSYPFDQRGHR